MRSPLPPKVERAGTDLFCLEIKFTFRLVPFHLLIPPGSSSNWALFWPYVIYAICHSVPNKGLYRAPVKVESAKYAAFNVLSQLQLRINGEKAL